LRQTSADFFTVDNDHTICVKTDRRPFVGTPTNNRKPCGSWLASDDVGSSNNDGD